MHQEQVDSAQEYVGGQTGVGAGQDRPNKLISRATCTYNQIVRSPLTLTTVTGFDLEEYPSECHQATLISQHRPAKLTIHQYTRYKVWDSSRTEGFDRVPQLAPLILVCPNPMQSSLQLYSFRFSIGEDFFICN